MAEVLGSDWWEVRLPAKRVRSFVFDGDSLVDWVGGGRRFALDGTVHHARVTYAFDFDSACATRGSRLVAIYQKLGTKGVVVDAETAHVIREFDRRFYHANAFAFPVGLVERDGRTLLVHCPADYNRIEIDDALTGERLTASTGERSPGDCFHSRFALNPSGTRLLTAGWVWHPWDVVGWFDVERALVDPTHLDRPLSVDGGVHLGVVEETSAAWVDDDHLLIGSSDEPADDEDAGPAPRLRPNGIAVVDVRTQQVVRSGVLGHPPGRMMPVGHDMVVTFFGHPRLYDLASMSLVSEWPDLPTGNHTSSIQHHLPPEPPMALDADGRRFAVAVDDEIVVVTVRA